ncbi:hypothetical protein [Brevundimonas sp. FT23028]|uniref:hypothetical protein n=1 Tax=Brevundimonas sp. FT23028 TaxID=3393748 RepID=UPI003B588092
MIARLTTALAFILVLAVGDPAVAQTRCGTPFHWSDPSGSVSVWSDADLVRITLTRAEAGDEEASASAARLILDAPATALTDGFRDAGMSVAPPAVPAGAGRAITRVRFGTIPPARGRAHRAEILTRGDGPDLYQAWVDYRRGSPDGPAGVRRFREAGSITVVLLDLSGSEVRTASQVRFDWAGVEPLIARARAQLAACPAG